MDKELKAALEALGMSQSQAIEAQQKAHKEFVEVVNADGKKRDAVYDSARRLEIPANVLEDARRYVQHRMRAEAATE